MGVIGLLLPIAIVNIVGGLMYGYAIGFVGVYNTYNSINSNCSALTTEAACGSVHFADCVWGSFANVSGAHGNASACYFSDVKSGFLCGAYNGDQSACGDHSACIYNHDSNTCEHAVGWSSTEIGIFAGAMIVGGMIGSFGAPPLLRALGRKRPILIVGVIAVVASVLISISRATNSYGLMIFARLLLGIASGITCVVCPTYVAEMTPDEYKGPVGVTFQISLTFGIMFAAFLGLVSAPTDFSKPLGMEARFQGFIHVQTILSVLVVLLGVFMRESDKMPSNDESTALQNGDGHAATSSEFSWSDMKGPLVGAFFVAVTLQLTGINAIMNYAPTIMASAGLSPLLGNFVVMAWNFVTTIASIPLASRMSLRSMFLWGTAFASGACFMTGIPVYPNVTPNPTTQHAIVGLGIFIFIAAFEITIGPTFYVLAQMMFPPSFRSKGSSFATVTQFVFNVIINVCFPIAVTSLSGGPAGNQNKGMGIVFMFFGSCGVVALAVLYKMLHPYEGDSSDYVEVK